MEIILTILIPWLLLTTYYIQLYMIAIRALGLVNISRYSLLYMIPFIGIGIMIMDDNRI